MVRGETLLNRLKALNHETAEILREARAAGSRDNGIAVKAIARVERQLEFEARLLGELSDSAKVAVGVSIAVPETEKRLDLGYLTTAELLQMIEIMQRGDERMRSGVRASEAGGPASLSCNGSVG